MNLKLLSLCAIIIIICGILTTACSDAPRPETAVEQFVSLWQDNDYDNMLFLLSQNVKDNINHEDFINKYKNITEGCSINNIQLYIDKEKTIIEKNNAEVFYSVKFGTCIMEDFVLNYNARLVLEDNQWKLQWTPEMIFPQLINYTDRVRALRDTVARGSIVDRNGNPLAVLENAHLIGVDMGRVEDEQILLNRLSLLLEMEPETIEALLSQTWVKPGLFVPIRTVPGTIEESKLREILDIPGVLRQNTKIRVYEPSLSHILGYIREISAEQLENLYSDGYRSGDLIGISGIENVFESMLRGKSGFKIITIDTDGREKYTVASDTPVISEDISLTIDINIQRILDKSMKGTKGAAIVMDASNGHLLGIISTPYYDSNNFIYEITEDEWNNVINNKDRPLFNRALQALYPPGSTIKPFIALLGLEKHTLKPEKTIDTSTGKWQLSENWGNYFITRMPHRYNDVNLETAMKVSDNIYFAQHTLKIGASTLIDYFNQIYFGQQFDFHLNVSQSSISNSGRIDNDVMLANIGFGQGELLTTPLHMTALFTIITNGGTMLKPQIVYELESTNGEILKPNVFHPNHTEFIKETLEKVVTEGTAQAVHTDYLNIAGKTGTAQVGSNGEIRWFISYTSVHNPEYIVAVTLEDTVEKNFSAVEVAKSIYDEMYNQGYFKDAFKE